MAREARTSRVDLYAAIRRDAKEGLSKRALQRKHGVGYRTVAAALASAWPKEPKPPPKRGSRLDPYRPVIDVWLRDDLDAPRKQRHTAKRIFDRLLDEHDAIGVVSYGMVRDYVATRRREIRIETGREPVTTFIPQTHLPGREGEVDFGEVVVRLRGELVTCTLFSLRLSYSGKAVHRISASAGQEAFFEGHVHAFRVLGGVPTGKIRYDNLKAAVASVIGFSRQRVEADRWTAFRSLYGIEAFYCQPGITGAHEKGGVEGDIGWFRRNHLVPIPEADSIEQLNAMVDAWDRSDEQRRIASRAHTIGEHFAAEQPLLAALPTEPFETGRWFTPRVDRFAQVSVRMNKYSVPARYVGRQIRVLLHASELVVYDGHKVVARHERLMTKGGVQLDLDHYLEVLLRKPGALPGATALEQARKTGRFTPIHDEWWAAACKTHGDAEGTRALIEVLLLHRHLAHEHVVAGLAAALRAGGHTADVVALEARKAEDKTHDNSGAPDSAVSPRSDPTVIASLTERRLRKPLPVDIRPLPTVDQYDQLLRRRSRAQE
ncbi:transposase [Gordonia sp. CNJ-863]|uniref:IS21 family transposase n=1 Tax=unclassified Gordonia (in: high G+C Gram-positive bacteria) TaxID=2657482 RepID=UPI0009597F32|nr:IS21 family transposase [Gordonia sp. CNJ-863]OLT52885.1 transposase [Gordonia sp. CNJ-863]